jgi:hypothetical protein
MPCRAFLKNANTCDIHTACGLYTFAAHCPGALNAFVTHNIFWASKLWDENCGYGDATPYRGSPIIDVSKLLAPLSRDEFYMSSNPVGVGNKIRVMVDLGFKMVLDADASGPTLDDDGGVKEMCPVFAEVAVFPRKIAEPANAASAYRIAGDMRLSPHNAVTLDIAYVMTVYLQTNSGRKNILNLNYNGARDVGCAVVMTGKKHAWSAAATSVIDEDNEEEDTAKRMKTAMDSVA